MPDTFIYPIGWVKLSVILGGPQNYEVEMLTFEVINLPYSGYKHSLGSRPSPIMEGADSTYQVLEESSP